MIYTQSAKKKIADVKTRFTIVGSEFVAWDGNKQLRR